MPSFRVPASSSAIHTSKKASAARPIPSAPATPKALSVAWSWAASSARNSSAMISPIPMPNTSDSTKRASARSAPMMPPV